MEKDFEKSFADFLLHTKSLVDSLCSVGFISELDLIASIPDGLGHDYKEFITSIHLQLGVSFDDFYDLQEEHLLEVSTSSSGAALVVNHPYGDRSLLTSINKTFIANRVRGHSKGKGRGRGTFPPAHGCPPRLPIRASINSTVACQICKNYKHGHSACLYLERGNFAHYAKNLADTFLSTHFSDNVDPNRGLNYMTSSLLYLKLSHIKVRARLLSAMDLNYLFLILVGLLFLYYIHLFLNEVLCALLVMKNLLSVCCFSQDNDCCLQMDSNGFHVKDNKTGHSLSGTSVGGFISPMHDLRSIHLMQPCKCCLIIFIFLFMVK